MRRLVAALAALFLSFGVSLPAFAACDGTITMRGSTDAQVGGTFDYTAFFANNGECGSGVNISLRYITGGQEYTVGGLDCPRENTGDGWFCVVLDGGKTYQLNANLKNFFTLSGPGSIVGQAFVNGTLVKSSDPFQINVSGQGGGPLPVAQQEDRKPLEVTLAVAIGGLTTTGSIATYLSSLYNWVIGIVSVFAISMVVWGGAKYLTAGADPSRLKSAKETIGNAFIGLLLALSSYLILSTVNPALLQFKELGVAPVGRLAQLKDTFCEEIVAGSAAFKTDPAPGSANARCGAMGTVLPTGPNSGTPTKPTCIFGTCPAGLGCAKGRDGNYACISCVEQTSGKLALLNLTGSDATCAQFGPNIASKAGVSQCVYSNDTGLGSFLNIGGVSHGCYTLHVSCNNIHTCEDYTTWLALHGAGTDSRGLRASYERRCLLDNSWGSLCAYQGPAGHHSAVCNADPCGVGEATGKRCTVVPNKDLTLVEQALGLAGPFTQADLETCQGK